MTANTTGNSASDAEISLVELYIEAVILSLICVFSIVGNTCMWIIVCRTKELRTMTNYFILGLTTADWLVSAINMPVTVVTLFHGGDWVLSDDACVLFGFTNMLTLVTSVMSLCNISINRYIMVCKPIYFKKIYTRRNTALLITACVGLSVSISLPPLFGWSTYAFIHTHSFCFCDWTVDPAYAFFMISACFGIPFSVMTICNLLIFRTVRRSKRKLVPKGITSVNDPRSCQTIPERTDREVSFISQEKNHVTVQHRQSNVINSDGSIRTTSEIYEAKDDNTSTPSLGNDTIYLDNKPSDSNAKQTTQTKYGNFLHVDGSLRKTSEIYETSDEDMCSPSSSNDKISVDNMSQQTNPKRNNPSTNKTGINITVDHASGNNNSYTEMITVYVPDEDSKSHDSSPAGARMISMTKTSATPFQKRKTLHQLKKLGKARAEEIRLATALAVIVVVFFICWFPYCISMLLSIFVPDTVPRGFHMFTLLVGYLNSGCNPVIYGAMNKRFGDGFRKLLCPCKR